MNKEEFSDWRISDQTKEIFEHIRKKREDIKELMAKGGIPQENRERTIGLCQAYADILAIEYNDLIEEEND